MPYNTHTTHDLLGVIRSVATPGQFWLDNFFPGTHNSDTQYIDFDKLVKGRRMAPFVAPTLPGRNMKREGHTTERFAPAYIKPKNPVEMQHTFKRMAGEMYTGSMTPEQRFNAIVADITADQRDMIRRRWNWMAFEAVANGSVTVSGENYPSKTVDFSRDSGQTVNLTGTDMWSDAGSSPLKDLETWSLQTKRLCGYSIRDWVMGVNAWAAFSEHADTQKLIEKDIANGDHSIQGGPRENRDDNSDEEIDLKAKIGVNTRIWVYDGIYEDNDGNTVNIMDPDTVIGANAAGLMGIKCFGAILDKKAGLQSMPIFPKMWDEEDPSVTWVMSQSAPLMVPANANASLKATVVGN